VAGFAPPIWNEETMKRYFKKPNGMRFMYDPMMHKLDSLKERFEECDENGKALPKPKKSSKGKEK